MSSDSLHESLLAGIHKVVDMTRKRKTRKFNL